MGDSYAYFKILLVLNNLINKKVEKKLQIVSVKELL